MTLIFYFIHQAIYGFGFGFLFAIYAYIYIYIYIILKIYIFTDFYIISFLIKNIFISKIMFLPNPII